MTGVGGDVIAARRRRPTAWAVAAGLVVALVLPAVGVYALLSDQSAKTAGVVTAGGLQLQADASTGSAVSWIETTPAIPAAGRRSGTDLATLAQFRGVPGDTVEVRYAITATIGGDNVSAVITTSLGQSLPAGVTSNGYRILTPVSGGYDSSATYAFGSPATSPAITSAGTRSYVVSLTLSWSGPAVYTSIVDQTDAPTLSTIPVVLRLDQVRSGTGFTS